MADVRWMTDPARAGRGSYEPGAVATAHYIAEEFRKLGLEVVRQPIAHGAENVLGIHRGDDRAVIVSAHYDHLGVRGGVIHPGADDNASGAAVLLGLARTASEQKFAHTLLFIAFGAEEEGLVGSAQYMAHPAWSIDKTIAVINFDMVGRNFFEAGANQERAAAVVGLEDHEGARKATERAAKTAGLKLVQAPARLLEVFGYANRTDEWWFRRRGVVSIHFSTGFHDDYHRPSDTADKLVPAQMSRVAKTAAGLLDYLAGRVK